MGLVEAVRQAINKKKASSASVKKLNKEGCKVSLKGVPQPRLVIDFDRLLRPDQKRCDYLFVAEVSGEPGWVVPLELKAGRPNVSQAVQQLQAGAHATERLIPTGTQVDFRPVVVSGSMGKAGKLDLRRNKVKVKFRGHSKAIQWISCGDPLTKALQ